MILDILKTSCLTGKHGENLLKATLSAVVIGITLGLLKSRNAAQKGTTKNGTFLQKAGRMLEPYFPTRATTSSAGKATIQSLNRPGDLCAHR